MKTRNYDIEKDLKYLQLLSHTFPTIADASTEIINLQAILNLPKGTEHFLADLHGEYKSFQHVLRMLLVILNVRLMKSLEMICVNRKSGNCVL